MKKIILLFCVIPFLVSTQCEEDTEQTIFKNNFKVKITNESYLNINDNPLGVIIWDKKEIIEWKKMV